MEDLYNIASIMLCFGISIKGTTVYSIITVLFSQFSKLVTISFTIGYDNLDLSMSYSIIPVAILGGYIGAKLSNIIDKKYITP